MRQVGLRMNVPDNALTRLEAREILHHLKSTCDPDVIQKLADIAQTNIVLHDGPQKGAERPVVPPNAPPEVKHALADAAASDGHEPAKNEVPGHEPWRMQYDPSWMTKIDPKTGEPWYTPEDVERINNERAISVVAGHQMADQIPYTKATPPELPPGHGIDRIPLGVRNVAGDMCTALRDPVTGNRYIKDSDIPADVERSTLISIFRCSRNDEHGYYAFENPNIKMCSRCFMSGATTDQHIHERRDSDDVYNNHSQREEQF